MMMVDIVIVVSFTVMFIIVIVLISLFVVYYCYFLAIIVIHYPSASHIFLVVMLSVLIMSALQLSLGNASAVLCKSHLTACSSQPAVLPHASPVTGYCTFVHVDSMCRHVCTLSDLSSAAQTTQRFGLSHR